jgi:hypothetical protein
MPKEGRVPRSGTATVGPTGPLERRVASLQRVTRFLLLVAGVAVTLAAVATFLWLRAERRALAIDELSGEARAELVEELLEDSPGVFRWAWFEPQIGFTLRPDAELTAWGDTFRSNDLGYRSGPSAKTADTLRVLFVGDSWTYGMGVSQEESFPKAFERVANRLVGATGRETRKVEAWTLALPGYNTFNEVAALWFFYGRLRPDAVVLCPVGNDNHSGYTVLPNGSTSRAGVVRDELGDAQSLAYGGRGIASFRYQERWRQVYAELRATEQRLAQLAVPSLFFFVASLQPEEIHAGVSEAGIASPYVVVPTDLTKGRWRNRRFGHGTPEANEMYGRMVYAGLAPLLDWPPLPAAEAPPELLRFDQPPPGDWQRANDEAARASSERAIERTFEPGEARFKAVQAPGLLSRDTGLVGRATSVLVRARPGDRFVHLRLRRLEDAPHLYPLALRASVPSPGGGSSVATVFPADGDATRRLALPIPSDLPPGAVLDVVVETARATAHGDSLAAAAIYLESVATSADSLEAENDALAAELDASGPLATAPEPGGAQR